MLKIWRSPVILGLTALLMACEPTEKKNIADQNVQDTASQAAVNCPTTDATAARFNLNGLPYAGQMFDFQAIAIKPTADTITFENINHNLVFCRATENWAILPPSQESAADDLSEEMLSEFRNPSFQSIEIAQNLYQYRVLLDQGPSPNENTPEKVLFEFIPAGSTKPISIDLYTLEKLKATGLGFDLGVPEVNGVIQVEDNLFLAISAEQGEGFSGITTLIRYNLTTKKLNTLQPKNLIDVQITDFTATKDADNTILWMGTKYSAEGAGQIPAKGLMSYQFTGDNWQAGKASAYSVHNSPLIGAIPAKIHVEEDLLWVATGNGICQVTWQQVKEWDAWQCWRLAMEMEIPSAGIPLYPSLLATVPATTLTPATDKTEVLWWSSSIPIGFADDQGKVGRFEVVYPVGLMATVPEGAFKWKEERSKIPAMPWDNRVDWAGQEWHWQGERFVRGFDEVVFSAFSLGQAGISERGYSSAGIQDTNALRGELKLLDLTAEQLQVEYFSGWVEGQFVEPYFVMKLSDKQLAETPNPIEAIAPKLESF